MNEKYKEIIEIFRGERGKLEQKVNDCADRACVHPITVYFCLVVCPDKRHLGRSLKREEVATCRKRLQDELRERDGIRKLLATVSEELDVYEISVAYLAHMHGLDPGSRLDHTLKQMKEMDADRKGAIDAARGSGDAQRLRRALHDYAHWLDGLDFTTDHDPGGHLTAFPSRRRA